MARMLATHKLKHDIVLTTVDAEGKETDEVLKPAGHCVIIRRPKGKDMRIVDDFAGRDMAMTMAMLGRITPLDAIEIDNLDAEDLTVLGELVGKALPTGPETGETSLAT